MPVIQLARLSPGSELQSREEAMTILDERSGEVRAQATGHAVPIQVSTDEVLAILAHEMRSPLGVIRNALAILQLVRTSNLVVEQQCDAIQRQVGYLEGLIRDLLDLPRFTAGGLELHTEWLDLATAVSHAVETSRPLVDENRHQLTVSLPPRPVAIRADPTRLQQILVNLLTNAAKYTDSGGRIWLTAEVAGFVLVLRVRDSGIGIAPDLLPRIFDLFRQGPGHQSRNQAGLGLGLTLVKWLVELHGGSVAARSDGCGKGAEFVVRLPASIEDGIGAAQLALLPPPGTCSLQSGFCGNWTPGALEEPAEAGLAGVLSGPAKAPRTSG
jgi:signal transduction histidine kinase